MKRKMKKKSKWSSNQQKRWQFSNMFIDSREMQLEHKKFFPFLADVMSKVPTATHLHPRVKARKWKVSSRQELPLNRFDMQIPEFEITLNARSSIGRYI